LAALFVGPFLLLGLVVAIDVTFGHAWGFVALAGAFAISTLVMLTFSRIADRRTSLLSLDTSRLPRDLLYCRRCGRPSTVGVVACAACGSTAFALASPAAHVRPRKPVRWERWLARNRRTGR
jgi:hypothetical protein